MIRIEGLQKRLGQFELRIPELCAERGEYLVLLGPSGAGKTVLLSILAGIVPPDAGQVYLNGMDVTHLPPERRNVGLVSQGNTLFPHLSVMQNIEFGLRYRRTQRGDLARGVEDLVNMLRIEHLLTRGVRDLSGGEQQRVAIARALAIRPAILLLDEPLATLDHNTRQELRGELRRIHQAVGATTVHVTHDRGEAQALADRIAVMSAGQVLQLGSPDDVFTRPACQFVAEFVGMDNIFAAHAEPRDDGTAALRVGPHELVARTCLSGEVWACVRPDRVRVGAAPLAAAEERPGKQNLIPCIITSMHLEGPTLRVKLDCYGLALTALCAPSDAEHNSLAVGRPAVAEFGVDEVHVMCGE